MTFTEKRISSTFIFNMSKQVCQDIGINKQTPAKTSTLESRPIWTAIDKRAFETCHKSAEFKKRNRFADRSLSKV